MILTFGNELYYKGSEVDGVWVPRFQPTPIIKQVNSVTNIVRQFVTKAFFVYGGSGEFWGPPDQAPGFGMAAEMMRQPIRQQGISVVIDGSAELLGPLRPSKIPVFTLI